MFPVCPASWESPSQADLESLAARDNDLGQTCQNNEEPTTNQFGLKEMAEDRRWRPGCLAVSSFMRGAHSRSIFSDWEAFSTF